MVTDPADVVELKAKQSVALELLRSIDARLESIADLADPEVVELRAKHAVAADLLRDIGARLGLAPAPALDAPRIFARGTGDHTEHAVAAHQAPAEIQAASHEHRIVRACWPEAQTSRDLSRAVGLPVEVVERLARKLCEELHLVNVSTAANRDRRPLWFRRVGDDGSPEELVRAVRYLCLTGNRTLDDLRELTGARSTRVSGARQQLVRDQVRTGEKLVNFGSEKEAEWRLFPKGAKAPR